MPKPSVFLSYSHRDRKDLEELRNHLKYLEKKKQLSIWDDKRIRPGAKWREEIEGALAAATVAVLLVSADFLASDFIQEVEMPVLLAAALEGKLTLLPVLLSHCLIHETPLAQFQRLNAQPLSLLSKGKREEEWSRIAEIIGSALSSQEEVPLRDSELFNH